MTIATKGGTAMPLLQRMRATRLPPPAQRRAIRNRAGLSREEIAAELRSQGFRVTGSAVAWWEKEKVEGGLDPRPAKAAAYRQLLDRIQRELDAWTESSSIQPAPHAGLQK